jgi:hypothetical protein
MRNVTTSAAGSAKAAEPKVYEVREFANLDAGRDLVLVRHVRTIHHHDGHISQEVLSLEACLEQMIRAFQGYAYQSAGTLTGFFDQPERARACARAIADHHGAAVEVCGTQVTITV